MMYPRTDGIYGTDFIKFLKYQIQYLIDSTKAAGKTFENGVVPSVVWEHPEVHTIPQLKQRIAELKYNNQGWQRFGSVIHTVNGEKVTSLAQSLHDMQWLEGQKFVAQLVWATWGFSPEEFMGGGENRASSYVKRNITKSRLLYPLMTFLEQRINREILPFLKGYRKFWKFSFVRDIELDDEQKVATTNSIKASTFLQYYQSGFPIEASMELSGLDKNKYKFDIDMLEAEIMQNQLMMSGQQPGEMGAGGLEDQEAGRYGPGSEGYIDAGIGDTGQGSAQVGPEDPSIEEEQYNKALTEEERKKHEEERKKVVYEDYRPEQENPVVSVLGYERFKKKPFKKSGEEDRNKSAESNKQERDRLQSEGDSGAGLGKMIGTLLTLSNKKKPDKNEIEKSSNINPVSFLGGVATGYLGGKLAEGIRGGKKKTEAERRKEATAPPPGHDKKAPEGAPEKEARDKWRQEQLRRHGEAAKQAQERDAKVPKQGKPNESQTSLHDKPQQPTRTVIVHPPAKPTPKQPKPTTPLTPQSAPGSDTGKRREVHSDLFGNKTPIVPKKSFDKSLKMDERDTRQDMDYDPYWLAQGIAVEMEHTTDPEIAKEIAKDHLDEFPNYYQALKRMENGLRKAGYKFERIEQYSNGAIIKAKVYITHPSEAPKGRPVRRGNKGGYYYITNQQKSGQGGSEKQGKQAQQKKKSGGKGWGSSGGGEQESAPMMPPSPPDIEGAEEQIKIEGLGIGIVVAVVNGHLVTKKLNNGPTNQFLKIVEKKTGENPNVEKIIGVMLQTAQEMGLQIYQ
jgi:hypothetical protein